MTIPDIQAQFPHPRRAVQSPAREPGRTVSAAPCA